MKPEQLIVEQAYWLALSVPQETIESAISVILNAQESRLQSEIFTRIPHHQHREMLLSFIESWCGLDPIRQKSHLDIPSKQF